MQMSVLLLWYLTAIPMVLPLFIMSLILLKGKGAMMIAGYNTMSAEKQAKYDEKALCRAHGKFLLWITFCLMFFPLTLHCEITWILLALLAIVIASTILFLIYANTGNRFLKPAATEMPDAIETESEKAKKKMQEEKNEKYTLIAIGSIIFGVFAVCISVPFILLYSELDPGITISETGIAIGGSYGQEIGFAEIIDISLLDHSISKLELTRRTNGYGSSNTQKGYFLSNKFGNVLLFTRTDSSPTIHIKRNGKEDVFLNLRNNEATKKLYDEMKAAWEGGPSHRKSPDGCVVGFGGEKRLLFF